MAPSRFGKPFARWKRTPGGKCECGEATGSTGTPQAGYTKVAGKLGDDLAPGTWGSIVKRAGLDE